MKKRGPNTTMRGGISVRKDLDRRREIGQPGRKTPDETKETS